ncbi:MAG: hypothetical protein JXQ29_14325 [Planctomycetes bacterium]|nr:hypothetical protein [Planctomycetota bacterium]
MSRHGLAAMIVALVVWAPAEAQRDKTQVEMKTGGAVVKTVIRNGEVVDEDVQIFGDLPDKVRDRVRAAVKRWRGEDGEKKAPAPGAKKAGKKTGKKAGAAAGDEEHAPRFRFGRPGIALHAFPHGEQILEQAERALERFGAEPGRRFRGQAPGRALRLFEALRARRAPEGAWRQGMRRGDDDGPGPRARARVRVEVNGKTVLDRELEGLPALGRLRMFGPGADRERGPAAARKWQPGQARPRILGRLLERRADGAKPGAPAGEALKRLEKSIEHLQRQIDQLKKELRSLRPAAPAKKRRAGPHAA